MDSGYKSKLKLMYEDVIDLDEERVLVKINGTYNVINVTSKQVINTQNFVDVKKIKDSDKIIVRNNKGKKGVLDKKLRYIVPVSYDSIELVFDQFLKCEGSGSHDYRCIYTVGGNTVVYMSSKECEIVKTCYGYLAHTYKYGAMKYEVDNSDIFYDTDGKVVYSMQDVDYVAVCDKYIIGLYGENSEEFEEYSDLVVFDLETRREERVSNDGMKVVETIENGIHRIRVESNGIEVGTFIAGIKGEGIIL